LLKACANQLGEHLTGKDRFVINSMRVSSQDLSSYFYLGVLMGVGLRTMTISPLNLPKQVWKALTGQRINLDDVVEVEYPTITSL